MKNLKSVLYVLVFVFGTSIMMGCGGNHVDVEKNKRASESLDDNRTEMQLKPMPPLTRPENYDNN